MKRQLVIHPFIFALYSVLFLYSRNMFEVEFADVFVALGAVLGLALLVMLVPMILKAGVRKTAIALSIFLLIFFSYGHLYSFTNLVEIFGLRFFRHRYLLPLFTMILILAEFLIFRSKKDLVKITQIFNTTSVFLLFLPLISIGISFANEVATTEINEQDIKIRAIGNYRNDATTTTKPDIYYIIFDEFAGLRQIKETYNYDNSALAQKLTQQGFYLTSESRTSYGPSEWSLTAALNMRYLEDDTNIKKKIRYSNVVDILKNHGYQYIHFGSSLSYTAKNPRADMSFNFFALNDFTMNLVRMTMLYAVYNSLSFRQDLVLNTLAKIVDIAGMDLEEPKFVFAHILSPHAPFVFGPEGEPIAIKNAENIDDKSFYLGQYIYISKRINKLAADILDNSKEPPVIIIQSDHGVKFIKDKYALEIFSAFYLPSNCGPSLPKSINPVNTFRIIFNCLFGTEFEVLKDNQL